MEDGLGLARWTGVPRGQHLRARGVGVGSVTSGLADPGALSSAHPYPHLQRGAGPGLGLGVGVEAYESVGSASLDSMDGNGSRMPVSRRRRSRSTTAAVVATPTTTQRHAQLAAYTGVPTGYTPPPPPPRFMGQPYAYGFYPPAVYAYADQRLYPPASAPATPHLASPPAFPQYTSYAAPAAPYSSPSMYPAQYAAPGFPPPTEPEPHVAWYYFSPAFHHGHYTIGFPHSGHADPSALSPHVSVAPYLDQQPAVDDPAPSGTQSPHHHHHHHRQAVDDDDHGSVRHASADKQPHRRSYHPNPPAHRSEWVMWAGNVPSGATHDELWRFFTAPHSPANQPADAENNGVLSIFLISRSSCAFVNYTSDEHLQAAIARFDDVALRPADPRCPRLVCRVRGKGDDLKAGVGYQRGMGMHTKWQKGKEKEAVGDSSEVLTSDGQLSSPGSFSDGLTRMMSAVSVSSDDENKRMQSTHSSSSGSYASTTSSFLSKYFPKRYFILKSLTQEDLDLSVERGVWATQKHNEEILDQAFRTSQEVYLIFGVNKSREFYGYARMTSPVTRDSAPQDVPWAARPPPHVLAASPAQMIISDTRRRVDASPLPMLSSAASAAQPTPYPTRAPTRAGTSRLRHSAPALLGEGYPRPARGTPLQERQLSLVEIRRRGYEFAGPAEAFELDETAPQRAMRVHTETGLVHGWEHERERERGQEASGSGSGGASASESAPRAAVGLRAVAEEDAEGESAAGGWGDSFAVEWLHTTRLPFALTRHLRNPWNKGKEIKVSRDGTELEPSVGEQLLREWPVEHASGA